MSFQLRGVRIPMRKRCKRCHTHKDMAGVANMGSTRIWWCADCRTRVERATAKTDKQKLTIRGGAQ